MADSPRRRSESPWRAQSRSRSLSKTRFRSRTPPRHRERSQSRSRGRTSEVINPGNTLYVTGLSSRVTERDLEEHFSKEVASCFLVLEPRSRISRGFGFVTMHSVEDANSCIKYLNQSVLDGRYITVEKSRRKRPRTPTPGQYLGLANSREGYGDRYGSRRSPRYSPPRGRRDYSPKHLPPRRSYAYSTRRSPPRGSRGYSPRLSPPMGSHGYSPRRDYSARPSPIEGRPIREKSYSPYDDSPGRRRYSQY